MNKPMFPGGNRTAAALAVVAAALWALIRFGGKPGASPAPPAAVRITAVAPLAPAAVKPRRTARKKISLLPVEPAKIRGAKLREKGEAFGGTTPDRVDKDTATAH